MPRHSITDSVDDISLDIFERIAKEDRKYDVSLMVIGRRPSEVNETMLSQCSNLISVRLTNAEDQGIIKRLFPDSLGGFSDILLTLGTGEALVVGNTSLLPNRIRIEEPKNKPNSGTVNFWDDWQKPIRDKRLLIAVDNWREQNTQQPHYLETSRGQYPQGLPSTHHVPALQHKGLDTMTAVNHVQPSPL